MKKNTWFRMQVKEDDPTTADIYIYDYIGSWLDEMMNEMFDENISVTAKAFAEELEAIPESVKNLCVHVNSPGGDVWGAISIANLLRDQRSTKGRTVETSVEGLAASGASIIIQAGDPIRVADNALVMVHNPWTVVLGEAKKLRKYADELDTITNTIISTYKWHSDLSDEEIRALMDATTWMEADEAIEKGFATEKVEGLKAAASITPQTVAKLSIPEKYKERVKAFLRKDEPAPAPEPVPEPEPDNAAKPADVLRFCRENNCLDIAESLIEDGLTQEKVESRVNAEKEKRAKAKARADEIRARCEKAKLGELADGYIKSSMSLEDIGKHIATITAKLDSAEIDGHFDPDQGTRPKVKISVKEVYANRNRLLVAGNKE